MTTYKEVTIYAVYEDHAGKVVLGEAQGTVHGSQVWAPTGSRFGAAFHHSRRIDRSTVDETIEAAIARFVAAKRRAADEHRRLADEADEQAFKAEQIRSGSIACEVDRNGVVVDTDRERVLAFLRAAPTRDRTGGVYYPLVGLPMATDLADAGIVRLVDYQCCSNGCYMVDLLDLV